MATLRDLWQSKGWSPTDLASRAGTSVPTLYSLNRKEGGVAYATVVRVCRLLNISLEEYDALPPCPHSARYQRKRKGKIHEI